MKLLYFFIAIAANWTSYAKPIHVLFGGTTITADDPIRKFVVRVANSDTLTTCAGVVVDQDLVMTAKHCLGETKDSIEVSVEVAPGQNILLKTKAFLPHKTADLALIRTRKPLSGLTPVEILDPGFKLKEGISFLAVGHERDGKMTKLALIGLSTEDESVIKTAQTPEYGICFGDSGGPLFYADTNGKLLLTGIASAVGNAACGQYSIFVKPQFYWKWIRTSVEKLHARK